ncbi:GNAT family N-acetyltransferase [Acinetobacter pseudolwoffii]|uniref:GNAT family N-acetyltransferase n=1 Tax=Acinetobacter pseudolwoffii TaxID=2053287 RepID=UPI000C245252|nr:GNAT family N-acetyltransferase [Acinetobacter pseudolwoffii]PJI30813.1 GNAT family N-acetyltransferase [Acinetobacter pseudolwoffii]
MKIRKATVQDTSAIVEVIAPFVEAVTTAEEGRLRFKAEVIQTIFERPDIYYYVAEIDRRIVGVVAYIAPAHFMHFFLNKAYQGQGYGRQMWRFLENQIRSQGHQSITVKSSLYALDIYKRFGFVEMGEYTEENGIRFIPMRKDYLAEI